MDSGKGAALTVLGAIVAFLLQIIVAPYITIAQAMPNFVAVFAMLLAVLRAPTYGCVLPFVLGLVFDFVSGGPVGAMAFSLTLFSVLAARFFDTMDNDTLFMALLSLALGLVFTELSYGVFLLATGYSANVLAALVMRALPCALYDCVIAFVLYPLAVRLFVGSGSTQPPIATQLR